MAAFSWFAGQRPLSSLARQASVKVALQPMSAFVRVMIKAPGFAHPRVFTHFFGRHDRTLLGATVPHIVIPANTGQNLG